MHRGFMNLLFFKQKERIPGERVDLVVIRKIKGNAGNNYIPSVLYHIVLHDTDEVIGNCDLRIGMDEDLYYAGNIGGHMFGVREENQEDYIWLKEIRQSYEATENQAIPGVCA